MIYIPIGIDCGNAEFLRKQNLRNFSFPFDWAITYNGISNIIKNDFQNLLPGKGEKMNNIYNVSFIHNDFPNDDEKLKRRIERFKNLLESSKDEICFIRKGHAFHHHSELNSKIKSDLEDAEELDIILQNKYPNLKYKIIVILVCGNCFDYKIKYSSLSNNILIYNIATPKVDDEKYEKLCLELFTNLI